MENKTESSNTSGTEETVSLVLEEVDKKVRGRKRKYNSLSEYYHSCNLHTKYKNLTVEKAQEQKLKYARLIGEIDVFLDKNKVEEVKQ